MSERVHPPDRFARHVVNVVVLIAALGAGACGKRGPPVAPELRRPAGVTQLDAVVRADGIEIAWTNPKHRIDGSRLRDLSAVRVFRAEDAGTGDPRVGLVRRGEVVGYTDVARIRLAEPAPAVVAGDRVTLLDAGAHDVARRYTYVVLAEDSIGRVGPPSERLSVRFVAVPDAPTDVRAEAGEGVVRLAWRPPARLVDATSPPADLRYEVLRAPSPDAALVPIAGEPVSATELVDRGLENDRAYEYAVRALRFEGRTRVVGVTSARIPATPVDVTPPSAPKDLVAIPSTGTVRLSWTASPEPDVARYIVYRAAPGRSLQRIGSVTSPATTFVDRDVPSGPWRYAVSAEDAGSRKNESARSQEASVSVP